MKNVAVLYPACSRASAKMLAKAVEGVAINPFEVDTRDFSKYALVINYGCNRSNLLARKILNKTKSIANCVDKIRTFKILKDAGVPTVAFVQEKIAIPKSWRYIVARQTVDGNKNEGVETYYRNQMAKIPNAPLYTEYFDHKKEFRVNVLNKLVCVAYEKVLVDESWVLTPRDFKYLEPIRAACVTAAKALDIDFVGFDVLVNADNEFVVLEANSGPVMTDEMLEAFKKLVNKLI